MQGLNRLLGQHSRLRVLRVLHHAAEPLSGREVERRSGLSNRAAMMALAALEDAQAVTCRHGSSAHAYELNRNHYFVTRCLRHLFDYEDRFWEDLRRLVQRTVRPRATAVVVTGSLARDDGREAQRLDLAILFATGRMRLQALPTLNRLEQRVHERYGLGLQCTPMDLNNMDRPEYAVHWRRIEREGLLLNGQLP